MSKKINFPKTIIVSGTARNVGKTTFVCQLITKYKNEDIIAIKVSPHFHSIDPDAEVIEENEDFIIIKEHKDNTRKDSSKMLKAGAKEVYFIMTLDESLSKVVSYLNSVIDVNSRIIIESAAIRRHINPLEFYLIYNNENTRIKDKNRDLESLVDYKVNFTY